MDIKVRHMIAALTVLADQAFDAKDNKAVMDIMTVNNYLKHSGHFDDNDTIVEII